MPRRRTLIKLAVAAAVLGILATRWLAGGDAPDGRAERRGHAPAPTTAAARPLADPSKAPAQLPAPTVFVAPRGDDDGLCSAATPCTSLNRAYQLAKPGQVVQMAGGAYGDQTIQRDPGKSGAGCESRAVLAACVIFRPAPGARVAIGNLTFGADYRQTGPAGIAVVAGAGRQVSTRSTNYLQAREVVTWGLDQANLYVAGGRDMAVRGGRVGGQTSADGLHPEIQSVYGSNPAIQPTRLTIEGVQFHDINTTSPTAHVDCLQVESGVDLVIRGNTFERCGSTGLRVSYGGGADENPPQRLLIEDNRFGRCVATPVSPCFYAAQLGVGHDVVVRGNVAEQALQPGGDAAQMHDVRYEENLAPGVTCEPGVTYVRNRWTHGSCSSTDRRITQKSLETALRVGSARG
jgi:hypothetical protein